MQAHEQAQFLQAVGVYVADQVQRHTAPLLQKIADLETKLAVIGATTQKYHDESMADIATRIAAIPAGKDGKDGRDGVDGQDGKPGADGVSVSLDDVRAVAENLVLDAVSNLPVPAAVVSVVGGFVDRDGNLCLTFSNGSIQTLGIVVGRDGKDVDAESIRTTLERLFAEYPKPRDGKDGRDGFGFDDIRMDYIDNEFWLVFQKGEEIKRFLCPVVSYQGIWRDGDYRIGHQVTFNGCQWIAIRQTKDRPGTKESGWQLCVKAGRDGKDGKDGERGPPGPKGENGRDLTQLGPDGSKWG
jgi:hypothetical protein